MSGEWNLSNMVLGSGQGSASSAYAVSKVWVWPYKSLLADISSPSCLFPQEHLTRETGLLGSRPCQGLSWDRPPVQRSGYVFLRASLVPLDICLPVGNCSSRFPSYRVFSYVFNKLLSRIAGPSLRPGHWSSALSIL